MAVAGIRNSGTRQKCGLSWLQPANTVTATFRFWYHVWGVRAEWDIQSQNYDIILNHDWVMWPAFTCIDTGWCLWHCGVNCVKIKEVEVDQFLILELMKFKELPSEPISFIETETQFNHQILWAKTRSASPPLFSWTAHNLRMQMLKVLMYPHLIFPLSRRMLIWYFSFPDSDGFLLQGKSRCSVHISSHLSLQPWNCWSACLHCLLIPTTPLPTSWKCEMMAVLVWAVDARQGKLKF